MNREDQDPLLDAAGIHQLFTELSEHLAARAGMEQVVVERLLNRYGDETLEMIDTITDHPELGEPVPGAEQAALQENDEDTAQRLREGAGNPYPQQRG